MDTLLKITRIDGDVSFVRTFYSNLGFLRNVQLINGVSYWMALPDLRPPGGDCKE